jgi:type II secretory pathway component GspD/PulD (secretin)/tetratricopeptide (TPR) repeat protein
VGSDEPETVVAERGFAGRLRRRTQRPREEVDRSMRKNIRIVPVALFVVLALVACRGRRTLLVDEAGMPYDDTFVTGEVVEEPGVIIEEGPVIVEEPPVIVEEPPVIVEEPPVVAEPVPAPEDALADETARRMAVESDKVRFIVQQKLEAARQQMRNGEFHEAERLLRQAKALDPANRDVNWELREVEGLLGKRGASAQGFATRQAEVAKLRIDEQRTKAAKLTNIGRMHLANARFDSAIENFDNALFIINSSPYEIEWGSLQQDAENGLRQAKYLKAQAEKNERREAIEDSLAQMAAQEEQELLAEQARLEQWMAAAVDAFNRDEFRLSEEYANRILEVQPDNTKARELQLAAGRARHDRVEADFLRREKLAFREWMDDIQATRVPQEKILSWPSRSFWERISAVRAKTRPTFGDVSTDTEGQALLQEVKGTTVNLSVDNQEFREVVKQLQIQTGYNIMVDPRIAPDVNENPVTGLTLTDVSLATALTMLQSAGGDEVVWTTKGSIIMFTNREYVTQNLVVQIHSVADLTSGLTNFIPPTIQLVGPDDVSDEENPLFGTEAEEPVYPYGQVDELIELIKGAVAPAFWEATEGAEIKSQGEQTLVVKSTPEIQEQVARFLDDLRGFAGIVVTVETRFLEISENFLRDVGVDFRGLGGQTPGTLVNLDDVTNGLEDASSAGRDNAGAGLPAAAALNPSAGAYFNDGRDGDFRGRTENIFDNPLGRALSSVGGSTFTLAYLDDIQLSAIVRATEKSMSARTLTAPVITVYNTQRANLTVVNQLSYIQDFDVEVAQTSFIADPIVGIIQDGLSLDVRPTVSNDRRYITLELQPTVADLLEPIPTFATSLASSFAPVIIQLPELRLQQARTTVRIPDQGSILIGGLKNIVTVDRQAETPFLGKIPLLSFLFSRKGRSDEVSHLMILVRAQITDLTAEEERIMGR